MLLVAGAALICLACEVGPQSGRGLRLPEGDLEAGKLAFQELACTTCHDVVGVPLEAPGERPDSIVTLGGEVTRVETYGQLVTSIVNPSHRISGRYPREKVAHGDVSMMANFNDLMTVAQLIDLTAFLQSRYELRREPLYVP
jgi:hypothetical protein